MATGQRLEQLERCQQAAHALAAAVDHRELTDLEALARLVEVRAARAEPTLAGRWRLVADLVTAVTEIDLTRVPPRHHGGFARFNERGFRAAYHSRDQYSRNQVRHVIGYLPVGFLLGQPIGWLLSIGAEVAAAIVRRQPVDWPDVWLGVRGVQLGAHLRSGAVPPDHAGNWLRAVVGTGDTDTTTRLDQPSLDDV